MVNGKNGNSTKREQTAKRIIDALAETNGLLTLAAKKAGVSYTTMNRYVHDYPSVAQAVQTAKESMLDYVESKLFTSIAKGNLTAIIFYLKTQGKVRGYIERIEQTGADGGPIKHNVNILSDQELEDIASRGSKRTTKEAEGT